MKEERDCLQEELDTYKTENEKMKTFLEKEVPMKAMKRSLVDLDSSVICLETEKYLLISKNEELLSCLSSRTMSRGRITDKLLLNILPVSLGSALNVEN